MKVKIFEGTSLDIEAQINEWVKEAQPNEVEFEMTYDGEDNGVKVHTVNDHFINQNMQLILKFSRNG